MHRPVIALAVILLVGLVGACGGDPGPDPAADARAARAVAQRVIDGMLLGRDPDAACAALTPEAQAGVAAHVPRLVLRDDTPTCVLGMEFLGSFFPAALGGDVRATAGAVTITGDAAVVTIDYPGAIRDRLDVPSGRLPLRRVDRRWLVTSDAPSGAGG